MRINVRASYRRVYKIGARSSIQIHDPHDRLFRNFLADISKAKVFLETYLPENIKKLCDFAALSFKPGSFVEKDLKRHFSDILYSVKIAGTEGYIYTLIEHETTPRKLTPFKLLRYQIAIMKQHLDQGYQTLPIVIPLLFYRGKKSRYPFTIDLELVQKNIHQIKIYSIWKPDRVPRRKNTYSRESCATLLILS